MIPFLSVEYNCQMRCKHMPSGNSATSNDNSMRLDKWLWCARFFKTRSLAAAAIKSGKVKVDGNRPKPAKTVCPGETLKIRRGPYEYHVVIAALSHQRLNASAAADLYTETAESIARREELALQLKAQAAAQPHPAGRPTKRQRREIIRFNKKNRES